VAVLITFVVNDEPRKVPLAPAFSVRIRDDSRDEGESCTPHTQ